MSIYDKSSLVLIPSGTKTSKVYSQKPVNGDGDFTFSRSTAATRVNADGNIEKETQNLLLQSNNFNTTWTQDANVVLTSGQSGYDGTNDAWKFDKDANQFRALRQTPTHSGVNTFSVYAKAGTLSSVNFFVPDAPAQIWFDLQTGLLGTFSSGIDANIEDVGGGWYRCSVTYNSASGSQLRIYPSSDSGGYTAVAGNIYIQDAQLEQGLVARDYIETTTAAVEGGITDNVPRLDYTDSSCPALLLEPQRTNGIAYSEYFDSYWDSDGQSNNITITHNATTSPEGLQNATKLAGNSTSNNPSTAYIGKASAVSSHPYVSSVFAKAGEYDYIILTIGSYASGFWASFNLDTGEVDTDPTASNTTASIEDYGDGWYRCMIHTTNTDGAEGVYFSPSVDGTRTTNYTNTTNGVYIFGAQVEAGSYATSYIPTYGTSVTRNADDSVVTSATDLIGQTEGTFFVDAKVTLNGRLMYLGQAGNFIETLTKSNGQVNAFVRTSATQADIYSSTTFATGDTIKLAFAYAQNDFVLYINGVQEGSDTNGVVPSNMAGIIMNNYSVAGYASSNYYNQALLFKTRLSNEELAALTTI